MKKASPSVPNTILQKTPLNVPQLPFSSSVEKTERKDRCRDLPCLKTKENNRHYENRGPLEGICSDKRGSDGDETQFLNAALDKEERYPPLGSTVELTLLAGRGTGHREQMRKNHLRTAYGALSGSEYERYVFQEGPGVSAIVFWQFMKDKDVIPTHFPLAMSPLKAKEVSPTVTVQRSPWMVSSGDWRLRYGSDKSIIVNERLLRSSSAEIHSGDDSEASSLRKQDQLRNRR
ncbi:hypothetical protein STEG23_006384, partial [Scotinomys teguina]